MRTDIDKAGELGRVIQQIVVKLSGDDASEYITENEPADAQSYGNPKSGADDKACAKVLTKN